VDEAIERYGAGGRLTDEEVGWLTVLLARLRVRDHAWERIDDGEHHVALWSDVVRRAETELVPAPASLLAFAAWRVGDGASASVAVDRALSVDPKYSMALLIGEALAHGLPPNVLTRWRPTRRSRRKLINKSRFQKCRNGNGPR
jgi:hypothetical protein